MWRLWNPSHFRQPPAIGLSRLLCKYSKTSCHIVHTVNTDKEHNMSCCIKMPHSVKKSYVKYQPNPSSRSPFMSSAVHTLSPLSMDLTGIDPSTFGSAGRRLTITPHLLTALRILILLVTLILCLYHLLFAGYLSLPAKDRFSCRNFVTAEPLEWASALIYISVPFVFL